MIPARIAEALDRGLGPSLPLNETKLWLIDESATMLILAGSVGTGKSVAAGHAFSVALAKERIRASEDRRRIERPRWVTATELAGRPEWECDAVASEMQRPPLVVIDDMGTEADTVRSRSVLQAVISRRHEDHRKRTVITTNLPGARFLERYGERIQSRLCESGRKPNGLARWWVECTGEDMRGRSGHSG